MTWGNTLGFLVFIKELTEGPMILLLIDKVNQRLSSWKARNLSFAGRITLTKSVLQAMPSYVMQTGSLPKSICDEVDKICRSFVWGNSEQRRKVHLVSWDTVCNVKKGGGLGLRKTRDVNQAYMMRASWRLCTQSQSLWYKVMRSKYKCGMQTLPCVDIARPGSNFWRGICNSWNIYFQKRSVESGEWNISSFLG